MASVGEFESPITIEINGVGITTFENTEELSDWAKDEVAGWGRVKIALEKDRLADIPNILDEMLATPRHIENTIADYLVQPNNKRNQHLANLEADLKMYENPRLRISIRSPEGQRILSAAKDDPDVAHILFARACHQNTRSDKVLDLDRYVSAFYRTLENGRSIEKEAEAHTSAMEALRDTWHKRFLDQKRSLTSWAEEREDVLKTLIDGVSETTKGVESDRSEFSRQMSAIKKSYLEEIKMRASKTYWAKKGIRNRLAAYGWLFLFATILVGAIIYMPSLYDNVLTVLKGPATQTAELAKPSANGKAPVDNSTPSTDPSAVDTNSADLPTGDTGRTQPTAVGTDIVGPTTHYTARTLAPTDFIFFVIPAVLLIWVLRIPASQFRINREIADDADERVSMIETFLALEQEEKAMPEERWIVLQALFRPHARGSEEDMPKTFYEALIDKVVPSRTGTT